MTYKIEFADDGAEFRIDHNSNALLDGQGGDVAKMVQVIHELNVANPIAAMLWTFVSGTTYSLDINCSGGACTWGVTYVLNGADYRVLDGAEHNWRISEVELIQRIRAQCAELSTLHGATLISFKAV